MKKRASAERLFKGERKKYSNTKESKKDSMREETTQAEKTRLSKQKKQMEPFQLSCMSSMTYLQV